MYENSFYRLVSTTAFIFRSPRHNPQPPFWPFFPFSSLVVALESWSSLACSWTYTCSWVNFTSTAWFCSKWRSSFSTMFWTSKRTLCNSRIPPWKWLVRYPPSSFHTTQPMPSAPLPCRDGPRGRTLWSPSFAQTPSRGQGCDASVRRSRHLRAPS